MNNKKQGSAIDMVKAAMAGNAKEIRRLISSGVSANASTKDYGDGVLPICWAALYRHDKAVLALIEGGADLNQSDDILPLHSAAQAGDIEIIDILVAAGAKVDCKDKYQNTPLMIAALSGNAAACARLLSEGANTELRNSSGNTALDQARDDETRRVILAKLEAETLEKALRKH